MDSTLEKDSVPSFSLSQSLIANMAPIAENHVSSDSNSTDVESMASTPALDAQRSHSISPPSSNSMPDSSGEESDFASKVEKVQPTAFGLGEGVESELRIQDVHMRDEIEGFFSSKEPIVAETGVLVENSTRYPRVNVQRICRDIFHLQNWFSNDVALPSGDQCPRDWFLREVTELGCQVRTDEIGNVCAILYGQEMNVAPIAIGSNLDLDCKIVRSNFEKVPALVGAVECLRTIKHSKVEHFAPFAAICWANEGSTSDTSCIGSAVWSGKLSLFEEGLTSRNKKNTALLQPQKDIAKTESREHWFADHRHNPLSAHFELHIGQHAMPEHGSITLGIVDIACGIRKLVIKIRTTNDDCNGTCLLSAHNLAKIAVQLTTIISSITGSISGLTAETILGNIAGEEQTAQGQLTVLEIDLRHSSDIVLDEIEAVSKIEISRFAANYSGFCIELQRVWQSPAATMDENAVACVAVAAEEELGLQVATVFISYDMHASAFVSTQAPSAIVYIAGKDKPANETPTIEMDYLSNGVQVLMQSVLKYDSMIKAYLEIVD